MIEKVTLLALALFGFSGCFSSTQPHSILNILYEKELQDKDFYGITLTEKERVAALANYIYYKRELCSKTRFPT